MPRFEFLQNTLKAIEGPREKTYGDPLKNHTRIAEAWSNILGIDVSIHQVYACLVAMKLSRLTNSPDHLDSWMDIAAYSALAGELCKDDDEA